MAVKQIRECPDGTIVRLTDKAHRRAVHLGFCLDVLCQGMRERAISDGLRLLCAAMRKVRARRWDDVYTVLVVKSPEGDAAIAGELSRQAARRERHQQFRLTGDRD